jgi:Co/Zn/Cd efflux system component
MSHDCHDHCNIEAQGRDSITNPVWRRALWIALALNLSMFVVELAAGLQADSVSLLADAVDFASDSP